MVEDIVIIKPMMTITLQYGRRYSHHQANDDQSPARLKKKWHQHAHNDKNPAK